MSRFVTMNRKSSKDEPALPSPEDCGIPERGFEHVTTSTLAGAVSGIAVGAIGGPPGAILGGIVGTAVGLMAGSALEMGEETAVAHDAELDDAIGVTRGPLGARAAAIAGLNQGDRSLVDVDQELSSTAALLRSEHQRFERVYDELLASYRSGDWNDVQARWLELESGLEAHIALEEERVFPMFQWANRAEYDALIADHAELRRVLSVLGVNIELHAVPERDAAKLIDRLRAHAEREEQVLYPWIEATLDPA
ncbi:MAG: Universal stress protein family [Labilithrix sp.]|nr:Universal stress protein family [Labilithrix sp.]